MLYIAGFVTVCEAFLGMEPHADLFRRMFSGRALSEGKLLMIASVGGFALQKKSSAGGRTPGISPTIPIGGGTGNGSTLGT